MHDMVVRGGTIVGGVTFRNGEITGDLPAC